MLLFEVSLIFLGFYILIKSGDILVDNSILIARSAGMSELVIGFTIVAFGTSAPELMINIQSAMIGSDDFVFGNILGSNTINILIALGLTGLIAPLKIKEQTIRIEAPFMVAITLIFSLLLMDKWFGSSENILSMLDGFILLICFLIFVMYNMKISKDVKKENPADKDISIGKPILFFLLSCFGLYIGGQFIVDNATIVGKELNISEAVMGLTVLAFGTSLPEIIVSIRSAQRGKADIAVGGMIGSNIFNILLVLSISAFVRPPQFHEKLNLDLIIVNISAIMLMLFILYTKDKTISKRGASLFLGTYIAYVAVRLSFYS